MKILVTGATGFIGSNIIQTLLENGYEIFATYRLSSSFEKCIQFKDKISWINTDEKHWQEKIKSINPDQLIHTAWGGINAENRNNWDTQAKNYFYSKEIFDLIKKCDIKKVIALGSQAEYGTHSYEVNENTVTLPDDAYGSYKILTANYLRNLFENSGIEWYWIRVFSVFGEGENIGWLIPSVISKLLKNESIPLTRCEQVYNYMYIKDFLSQLLLIVQCSENKSGIYNFCSSKSITLKEIVVQIANHMKVSKKLLQFGALQYRCEQNMRITGDNTKFKKVFSIEEESQYGLTNGLIRTIEYYKKRES